MAAHRGFTVALQVSPRWYFQDAPQAADRFSAFLPRGMWQWLIPPMSQTRPSQSAEDYLERIHELIQEKGYARVVDIASSLDVKQASATSMVQKLGELGYLNYVKYRGLVLTDKGREVA